MFKITTDPDRLNGLRGNMQRCCEHAANGSSRVGLTRAQIISNIQGGKRRSEVFERLRQRIAGHPTNRRTAQVKRIENGRAFHVVGLGRQDLTLNELKIRLNFAGFTDYRYGKGKPANLAGKVVAA